MSLSLASRRSLPLLFAAVAVAVSLAVLHRWVWTPLGVRSFGRVWQLYVSYADFGFMRRGLVGTLFDVTGLNRAFANEYVFAFVQQSVEIVVIAALLTVEIVRRRIVDPLFLATLYISPVLVIQMGYVTGALDPFVLILAMVNMFFVRRVWLLALLMMAGVLVHELFLFTIPAQIVGFALRRYTVVPWAEATRMLAPSLAAAGVVMVLVLTFGQVDMPLPQFELVMAAHMPTAAYQHPLWSGAFEVAASLGNNRSAADMTIIALRTDGFYTVIPVLFAVLVALRAALMASQRGMTTALLTAGSALLPLLTTVIATDLYRWFGMAGNMGLLLSVLLVSGSERRSPRWLDWLLLSFVVVAPFGSGDLARPFPVQQFVLEHLLR